MLTKVQITIDEEEKLKHELKKFPHSLIKFPDSFVEKINLEKIKAGYQVVYGGDLSINWIEENLMTFDLFLKESNYLIIESNTIPEKIKNFIIELNLSKSNKIILSSIKNITNKKFIEKFNHIEFKPIKFWETDKYFKYLANSFNLKLSPKISNYILASVNHAPESLYQTLNLLSRYDDKVNCLEFIKEIIRPNKIDHFEQAEYINKKNMKQIFLSLLLIENDFDLYRNFFNFFQGHILKILDPSYSESKMKTSKYDKDVKSASLLWNRSELYYFLSLFSDFEIMAKNKNIYLKDRIRVEYLRT